MNRTIHELITAVRNGRSNGIVKYILEDWSSSFYTTLNMHPNETGLHHLSELTLNRGGAHYHTCTRYHSEDVYSSFKGGFGSAYLAPLPEDQRHWIWKSEKKSHDNDDDDDLVRITQKKAVKKSTGSLKFQTSYAASPYHHKSRGVLMPCNVAKSANDYGEFYSFGCGDDSFFIKDNALAVADGIGGWIEVQGANAALYSRNLLSSIYKDVQKNIDPKIIDVKEKTIYDVLENALQSSKDIRGSTTLSMVLLNPVNRSEEEGKRELIIYHIGDSIIMIIRNNKLVYRSKDLCHGFNFPYQLPSDSYKFGLVDLVTIEKDDILLLATDGLVDNMSDGDILETVNMYHSLLRKSGGSDVERSEMIQRLASELLTNAEKNYKSGKTQIIGGGNRFSRKPDDISIVIGYVYS